MDDDHVEPKDNFGKAPKGKGKAPMKGGCFNCGGEHFVRDCPHAPSSSKGKGKDPWVTQTAWNGWYPSRGFQKSKGKGGGWKGNGKGKGKANMNAAYGQGGFPNQSQSMFPPLGAVFNEQNVDNGWGDDYGWDTVGSGLIGAVTKSKPKFQKTKLFDEAVHNAISARSNPDSIIGNPLRAW